MTSFMGISDVTTHSVPTTVSFLKKLVPIIKEENPSTQTIHFVSHSPKSQYRNRSICYLVANFERFWGFMLHGSGGRRDMEKAPVMG